MSSLAQKKCIPCTGGIPPLNSNEASSFLEKLGGNWKILENHHLEKEFSFSDFKEALHFTNQIGTIAEEEGHHPDILLAWGKVKVTIWTHKVNGLTESDFILAAKIDALG